jgi:flagellar biosynthesis/type III secretory pathway protein FliH
MVLPRAAAPRYPVARPRSEVATMPRRKPPSRLRYEAEHPSLTVRIPAEVKAKVLAAAQAEGLSVSEWVQAMAAGHAAKAADAYRRGQEAGRQEGDAEGYERGRGEGEQLGGTAGFRAGILAANFAADHGRSYNSATIAQRLAEHRDQGAIAERLIPADYQRDWARLLRAAEQGRAPVTTP